MSIPIDDEVYGDRTSAEPASVKQGNPGRPQSDFAEPVSPEIEGPREPAGEEHAAENAENEEAG
jgi:hypothetical protein